MGLVVRIRHKRQVTKADVSAALSFYSKLTGKPQPFNLIPSAPLKKRKVSAHRPEHNEQVDYVRWFRDTYPGVLIFAIPNGGARDAIIGFKLKQEGVVPDVPDLFAPKFRLFVEMKRVDGERPRGQRLMATYLVEECGYRHIFGMGAEDARQKTLRLLGPQ